MEEDRTDTGTAIQRGKKDWEDKFKKQYCYNSMTGKIRTTCDSSVALTFEEDKRNTEYKKQNSFILGASKKKKTNPRRKYQSRILSRNSPSK